MTDNGRVEMKVIFGVLVLLLLCGSVPAVMAGESYAFVTKWGEYGYGNGQFDEPYGVAVDTGGYVYVVGLDQRLQKFTTNGSFVARWGANGGDGTYGSGNGQFYEPEAVAVDPSGYVYVAESGGCRVQKFTSTGTFVTKWGERGSGDGMFYYPGGIAADTAGYIYVADGWNNRVQKFNSTGGFIAKWGRDGGQGSSGEGDGEFDYPRGIAVDTAGNVFVADTGNDRVQKFDSNGTFIMKWGRRGAENGQFHTPCGIAVDAAGNVYVTDGWNSRVQKFTSDGTFVTTWGTDGSGDGMFDDPWGISVDGEGDVYVADRDNYRVQKFTPVLQAPGGGGFPTDTDGDGMCDDVNGNERKDFADVVLFFNQMTWIGDNEPIAAFDYNGNGRIDFADVVWLFNHL
jgi:sugar lactone lactonase YvrE